MRRLLLLTAMTAILIAAALPGSASAANPQVLIKAPDNAWFVSNPTITFEMTDTDGDFGGFTCALIAAPDPVQESDLTGCGTGATGSFTPNPVAANGTYQFGIQAYDMAANESLLTTIFVHVDSALVDTTAPVVTLDGPGALTNNRSPALPSSFTELHVQKIECSYDGGTSFQFCIEPAVANLADGPYSIIYRVTDARSNVGQDSVAFSVDGTPPTIVLTGLTDGQTVPTPFPDYTLSTPDGASLQCYYDNDPGKTCDAVGHSANGLSDGAHTMHLTATDLAGNVTNRVVTFNVDGSLGPPDVAPLPTLPRPSKVNVTRSGTIFRTNSISSKFKASFAAPIGVDPKKACVGKVTLSLTGKLKGKKSKTFSKRLSLKPSGGNCAASGRISIPRAYKGKRLKAKLSFGGNAVMGAFAISSSLKKL